MTPRLDVVRSVASKYPATLTHEQCALIVNEVAWLLNKEDSAWGISAKPDGKNARLPNGTPIAEDILHYRTPSEGNPYGTIIDILVGAPARNEPAWIVQPYHGNPTGRPWLPPFDPATFGSPTSPVAPPVAGPTLQDVLTAIALLQDRLTALAHDQNVAAHELLALRNDYRKGMIVTLNTKPFGTSTGTVKSPA